jgi:hypothetical protein
MYGAVPDAQQHAAEEENADAVTGGGSAVKGGGWPWGSSRERVACLANQACEMAPKTPGPSRPALPISWPPRLTGISLTAIELSLEPSMLPRHNGD